MMKTRYSVAVYGIAAIYILAYLLCFSFNQTSCFQDVLFLNIDVMEEIGLSVPNTEFSCLFLLYVQLLIYELTGIYNEAPSYLSLCAHRLSRMNLIRYRFKSKAARALQLTLYAFVFYTVFCYSAFGSSVYIRTLLYLIRLHFLVLMTAIICDAAAMMELSEQAHTAVNCLLVISFLMDTWKRTGIIAITSETGTEIVRLSETVIICCIVLFVFLMKLKHRKDLL